MSNFGFKDENLDSQDANFVTPMANHPGFHLKNIELIEAKDYDAVEITYEVDLGDSTTEFQNRRYMNHKSDIRTKSDQTKEEAFMDQARQISTAMYSILSAYDLESKLVDLESDDFKDFINQVKSEIENDLPTESSAYVKIIKNKKGYATVAKYNFISKEEDMEYSQWELDTLDRKISKSEEVDNDILEEEESLL